EPCDRDCGIGSTAAINDEKVLRLDFSVRLRKTIDPEDLVKRDDAGAQDDGCVGRGAPGTHRSFTLFATCETRASPNVGPTNRKEQVGTGCFNQRTRPQEKSAASNLRGGGFLPDRRIGLYPPTAPPQCAPDSAECVRSKLGRQVAVDLKPNANLEKGRNTPGHWLLSLVRVTNVPYSRSTT